MAMWQSVVVQPPVARYDLSASAKIEFSQIVARNQWGMLRGGDLKQQVHALDSSRFETPCTFMMHNFEQHKRDGDEWTSHPFYTAPHGYKLNLSVYANGNGDGTGTHVSVFLQLMPGEFDDRLRWPFRGSSVVKLLDQSGNGRDVQQEISYGYGTPEHVARRPTYTENTGWGMRTFLAHRQLYTQSQYPPVYNPPLYIKDGCVQFQVLTV